MAIVSNWNNNITIDEIKSKLYTHGIIIEVPHTNYQ